MLPLRLLLIQYVNTSCNSQNIILGENVGNVGGLDAFIGKYDAEGTRQWVHQFGTSGHDSAHGIAVDSEDNVYVVGSFDDDSNTNSGDAYVSKFDPEGSTLWVDQFGLEKRDVGGYIAVDQNDNIYLNGWTTGGLDGAGNAGSTDIFFAKYDIDGVRQWSRQIGTSGMDSPGGMAFDSSGNFFMAGSTTGAFGNSENTGYFDMLLFKYDASGDQLWVEQLETDVEERGIDVAVDSNDNTFLYGHSLGNMDGIEHPGNNDSFIIKYSTSGEKQ